jgi:hypothetical protein
MHVGIRPSYYPNADIVRDAEAALLTESAPRRARGLNASVIRID